MRIKREIEFDQVNWPHVLLGQTERFGLKFNQADERLRSFRKRFLKPLEISWFRSKKLSIADSTVVTAICETLGADKVTLSLNRPLSHLCPFVAYQQSITFIPDLEIYNKNSKSSAAEVIPAAKIEVFGKNLNVHKMRQVIILHLLLASIAVAFYVVVMGAFLYSTSVFIIFLADPMETTRAALHQGSIGLALLCFLVASSAICHRAVRNICGLVLRSRFFAGGLSYESQTK